MGFVVFIIEVMCIADSFTCGIKWSHAKDGRMIIMWALQWQAVEDVHSHGLIISPLGENVPLQTWNVAVCTRGLNTPKFVEESGLWSCCMYIVRKPDNVDGVRVCMLSYAWCVHAKAVEDYVFQIFVR